MRKRKLVLLFILIVFISSFILVSQDIEYDATIAMCRPTISQIKNIEWLYEKDLIILDKIQLLCIYHEDELTDYKKSYEYVKNNRLFWVKFIKIKEKVKVKNMFKKNKWTKQFKDIFNMSDGIIFTGGMDIPPYVYNSLTNLLTEATTPVRSLYEISFMFHLLGGSQNSEFKQFLETKKNYPVFGICLGAQTMNVGTGGTIYQDIPTEIYNINTKEEIIKLNPNKIHTSLYLRALHPTVNNLAPAFHQINIKKNSFLTKILGFKKDDTPYVLTSHHQALKDLGKNLEIIATSMDNKIIEAVHHNKYKNVFGVQFHPEPYSLYLKGKFFRKKPGGKINFNIREFLINNPPSMKFHEKIWAWFSEALIQ